MSNPQPSSAKLFLTFLQLGLTSFGGPIAHIGYFRETFVERLKWLDEKTYADLVALCQFLPGPTSSQVGLAIGMLKGGRLGAALAWIGFTIPSAIVLMIFGYALLNHNEYLPAGLLLGLKAVAVGVVAQAIWGMGKSFCVDKWTGMLILFVAGILIYFPWPLLQICVLFGAGLIWAFMGVTPQSSADPESTLPLNKMTYNTNVTGLILFVVFVVLLILPTILSELQTSQGLDFFDSFYKAGALVFGGGHVVLPFLETAMVGNGLVDKETFMAGYGAAQAVPGPLFAFAAFLGYVADGHITLELGAIVALLTIFLPSFLLVPATLSYWNQLRHVAVMQKALVGINAAVVGLLFAAFVDPILTSISASVAGLGLALLSLITLLVLRWPSWMSVVVTAGAGLGLDLFGVL